MFKQLIREWLDIPKTNIVWWDEYVAAYKVWVDIAKSGIDQNNRFLQDLKDVINSQMQMAKMIEDLINRQAKLEKQINEEICKN